MMPKRRNQLTSPEIWTKKLQRYFKDAIAWNPSVPKIIVNASPKVDHILRKEDDAMSFANVWDAKITAKINLDCVLICKVKLESGLATAKSRIVWKNTANATTTGQNVIRIVNANSARTPKISYKTSDQTRSATHNLKRWRFKPEKSALNNRYSR